MVKFKAGSGYKTIFQVWEISESQSVTWEQKNDAITPNHHMAVHLNRALNAMKQSKAAADIHI